MTWRNVCAVVPALQDNVEILLGFMHHTGLRDNSVDVVLSGFNLHTVPCAPTRRLVLEEAFRVCKPGGRLVFADIIFPSSALSCACATPGQCVAVLEELGCLDVKCSKCAPLFCLPTYSITATKSRLG